MASLSRPRERDRERGTGAQASQPFGRQGLGAARQDAWIAAVPVGERRQAASLGMAWGTRLHAALDWLSGVGGHAPAGRPPEIAAAEWPALKRAALSIIGAPGLRPFFDPARYLRALNEVEFVLADGSVGRIDRLVETEDCLWVLDYKSGEADAGLLAGYRAQLESYRQAVSAVFPAKLVRCGLIFGNGEWVEN